MIDACLVTPPQSPWARIRMAEIGAAGVHILEAAMTVQQVADMWSPYPTMAEGIKIAAQSFPTDITPLACCAD